MREKKEKGTWVKLFTRFLNLFYEIYKDILKHGLKAVKAVTIATMSIVILIFYFSSLISSQKLSQEIGAITFLATILVLSFIAPLYKKYDDFEEWRKEFEQNKT